MPEMNQRRLSSKDLITQDNMMVYWWDYDDSVNVSRHELRNCYIWWEMGGRKRLTPTGMQLAWQVAGYCNNLPVSKCGNVNGVPGSDSPVQVLLSTA